MRQPENNNRYEWTAHSWEKMQYYNISEGRIKRIIRFPERTEEGIAEDTVAVMQKAGTSRYSEIWVMYSLASARGMTKSQIRIPKNLGNINLNTNKRIRIITAWRYPGKSPERDPIPSEVLEEIRSLL